MSGKFVDEFPFICNVNHSFIFYLHVNIFEKYGLSFLLRIFFFCFLFVLLLSFLLFLEFFSCAITLGLSPLLIALSISMDNDDGGVTEREAPQYHDAVSEASDCFIGCFKPWGSADGLCNGSPYAPSACPIAARHRPSFRLGDVPGRTSVSGDPNRISF